jgi:DNA-binding transcriptional LysR family regulator
MVGPDIKAGRLQIVLPDNPPTELGIYALYAPNRYLAAKTRVFVDFLVERFGETPQWDDFPAAH